MTVLLDSRSCTWRAVAVLKDLFTRNLRVRVVSVFQDNLSLRMDLSLTLLGQLVEQAEEGLLTEGTQGK